MATTSSYSKKVEIFNDPGEYDGSKEKFEEWWAKMQAWLMVNQHAIPTGLQNTVSAVLSRLKGPKAGPFAQVCLTQVAQGTYMWYLHVEPTGQRCRRVVLHNQQKGLGKEGAPQAQTRKTPHR